MGICGGTPGLDPPRAMLAQPHLLPSAGTWPGHCLSPGVGQPPAGASAGSPCLQNKEKEVWGSAGGAAPRLGLFPAPLDVPPHASRAQGLFGWQGPGTALAGDMGTDALQEPGYVSDGVPAACSPMQSRIQPTVPSPPQARMRKSGVSRKKLSLDGAKRERRSRSRAGGCRGGLGRLPVAAAPPYPGVGPPRSRLYTCRGLSR